MVTAVVAIAFLAVGAALSWVAWVGSQRRLAPGGLVGLPMSTVRSSESDWYAAHEAAAGPLGLGGGVALTCGVGVVVVGTDLVGWAIAAIGALLVLSCVVVAVVGARRATGTGS